MASKPFTWFALPVLLISDNTHAVAFWLFFWGRGGRWHLENVTKWTLEHPPTASDVPWCGSARGHSLANTEAKARRKTLPLLSPK
jgi:hypothetical protein